MAGAGDWWQPDVESIQQSQHASQKVSDFFHLNVGRVVPHRDLEAPELPSYPYFDVQHTPSWQTITVGEDKEKRHFRGTTFKPPFVLIRRNSRAKDAIRAVGTIVVLKRGAPVSVAVENHLMVARPISGKVEDCEALLELLRLPQTNQWLDKRIRCRHLTVGAVNDIPWLLS